MFQKTSTKVWAILTAALVWFAITWIINELLLSVIVFTPDLTTSILTCVSVIICSMALGAGITTMLAMTFMSVHYMAKFQGIIFGAMKEFE